MPWAEFFSLYGLVLGAVFFGAFVARATGVGFALLLVAALLALPHLDQPTALFLIAPLGLMNLGLIALTLHQHTPWTEARIVAVPLLVGIAAGLAIGVVVSKLWVLIFGLLVVGYNIWTMVRPNTRPGPSAMSNPWLGGSLTGVMTGGLFFPGPPMSAYMIARSYMGNTVRMAVALAGLIGVLIRLLFGWPFITWQAEFWQVLLCSAILISLATFLGHLAAVRMSAGLQRTLIILLTIAAFAQLSVGLWQEAMRV